ncbi:hypothetical protein PENTCL1PPCAC_18176, partial [Pristionchus entomophagus]
SFFSLVFPILQMGGETPRRTSRISRIPPPSSSIILPTPNKAAATLPPGGANDQNRVRRASISSNGTAHSNDLSRPRRVSISTLNDQSRPTSTTSHPSGRLSVDLPDLNLTSDSATSASRVERIGQTPHLPRYMKDTSSKASKSTSSNTSKIPLPIRVTPNGNQSIKPASGIKGSTPCGSIASLNELSFSSDRCGPTKRPADTASDDGPVLRGRGGNNLNLPLKRRRFDEIQEAIFQEKMSDEEKVIRFEKKMSELQEEYEKEIRAIYEKREKEKEKKREMEEIDADMRMKEKEEVAEEKAIDNSSVKKSSNSMEKTEPRGLDLLSAKFSCVRDALLRSRGKSESG